MKPLMVLGKSRVVSFTVESILPRRTYRALFKLAGDGVAPIFSVSNRPA
jgi:hypothetical protein